MQAFTREITRVVNMPSYDPALPPVDWVIGFGPGGLSVRRKGDAKEKERKIGWRMLIGLLLVHGGK